MADKPTPLFPRQRCVNGSTWLVTRFVVRRRSWQWGTALAQNVVFRRHPTAGGRGGGGGGGGPLAVVNREVWNGWVRRDGRGSLIWKVFNPLFNLFSWHGISRAKYWVPPWLHSSWGVIQRRMGGCPEIEPWYEHRVRPTTCMHKPKLRLTVEKFSPKRAWSAG